MAWSGFDPKKLTARFEKFIVRTPTCWFLKTKPNKRGYSRMSICNRRYYAHRVYYELIKGKIPIGLMLDHLCRNRRCVNPDHLEPVTIKENVMRGESPPATNDRKTQCSKGHPFDSVNTYYRPNFPNQRFCKRCTYEKNKIYRRRRIERRKENTQS